MSQDLISPSPPGEHIVRPVVGATVAKRMSQKKNRLILMGGVVFTLSVLSITAIYLPYYADGGRRDDDKEEFYRNKMLEQNRKANSMWKNLDNNSKKGGQ
jgi:type II secretory pathway component PulM